MGKLLVLTVALFVLACATSRSRPIVGPDGTENQLVEAISIDRCYEKAREVCGGNYKIVNSTSEKENVGGTTFSVLVKCDKR
jgi:hypothetical protein